MCAISQYFYSVCSRRPTALKVSVPNGSLFLKCLCQIATSFYSVCAQWPNVPTVSVSAGLLVKQLICNSSACISCTCNSCSLSVPTARAAYVLLMLLLLSLSCCSSSFSAPVARLFLRPLHCVLGVSYAALMSTTKILFYRHKHITPTICVMVNMSSTSTASSSTPLLNSLQQQQ